MTTLSTHPPGKLADLPWTERLVAPDRPIRPIEGATHRLGWGLVRMATRLLESVEVEGAVPLPSKGPLVVVANHCSHLDTAVLAGLVPRRMRPRFSPIAAGDHFFRNPLQAWLLSRLLNLRPLWRGRPNGYDLRRMRRALIEEEACFAIFPEGTRSRDGRMGAFRPGIGMLVAGSAIPVVPCHLSGTHEAWPAGQRWPSPGRIRVRVGPALHFGSTSDRATDWRAVAGRLESEVRQLGRQPPPDHPSNP